MPRLLLLIKLLFLVLLISACSKRVVDLDTVKIQNKLSSSSDSTSSGHLQINSELRKISFYDQQNDYQVDIVPDGDFKYDPNTGFSGKAKSISIKGKSQLQGNSSEQRSDQRDTSYKSAVHKAGSSETSVKSKKKDSKATRIDWLSILIICAALVFFIWIIPIIKRLHNGHD